MNNRNPASRISPLGARTRRRTVGAALAAAVALGACDQGTPLQPDGGPALPPDRPSALLNPLCGGTGGTTHAGGTISTPVTWAASGNPHRVTATVLVSTGGTLTLGQGTIVCFEPQTGLNANGGGRLVGQGSNSSPVVLTARDPVLGWYGMYLQGVPASTSYISNARVEYADYYSSAIVADGHPLLIDSTVVRQSGGGVRLAGRTSRLAFSRVDTTTNRAKPAVILGDSATFEQSVIRRAAGTGLHIEATAGARVLGGRIEGSRGTGIVAPNHTGLTDGVVVRVVGGASYPIEATTVTLRNLYITAADQDSLKGNARDTVLMLGGNLGRFLAVRAGLPWRVMAPIHVKAFGNLGAHPGSLMVLHQGVGITTASTGRLNLRGAPGNPVVLTAEDPALGWAGITADGTPAGPSYVTNAHVEHVAYADTALVAQGTHPVIVDSSVFRQNGRAIRLLSSGSRLSRTRVDTTLNAYGPAVELGADAILESTRILGSSGGGVAIISATVQVQSCEVRESVADGIVLDAAAPVNNCNLVDNGGVGVRNNTLGVAQVSDNWWGDATGPFGPNGDGLWGTANYTPFLTAPYVLPYVP